MGILPGPHGLEARATAPNYVLVREAASNLQTPLSTYQSPPSQVLIFTETLVSRPARTYSMYTSLQEHIAMKTAFGLKPVPSGKVPP